MNDAQRLEKGHAIEKKKTVALEAKLHKKKKKLSMYKASSVEFKRKLDAIEVLFRSKVARADTAKKEKKKVKAAIEIAAKEVIEAYKKLDAFQDEEAEAAANSYFFGFENC